MITAEQTSKVNSKEYTQRIKQLEHKLKFVAAEAVKEVPANPDRDKDFCSFAVFNQEMARQYPALHQPMTHRQWSYILSRAHHAVSLERTTSGHITEDAIAKNMYAMFIRQTLVHFVNTYGLSHCLKQLNLWDADFHRDSRGLDLAAEICANMLNPVQTRKKDRKESIVSACIRKKYEPPQITAHIQLAVKNDIRLLNEKEQNAEHSELSLLNTDPTREETVRPSLNICGSIPTNDYSGMIRKDFQKLYEAAYLELSDRARLVLDTYLDKHYREITTDSKTFARTLALNAELFGLSERGAKAVATEIVETFRRVMEVSIERKNAFVLMIKNPSERSKIRRGTYGRTYKNQELVRAERKIDNCFSRHFDGETIEQMIAYTHNGGTLLSNVSR